MDIFRFRPTGRNVVLALATMILTPAFVITGASAAGALPFVFLAPGFTQALYATGLPFAGGVAFAPNGDPLVAFGTLYRIDSSTTITQNGSTIHPTTPHSASLGLGLANALDGSVYANLPGRGVVKIDPGTGSVVAGPFGAAGNQLGIALDPQTHNLVYVGSDGRFYFVSPDFSTQGVFSTQTAFADGIAFEPTGKFLFTSSRGQLAVLDRNNNLVQQIPLANGACCTDGIAFHSVSPQFVISNNTDGTITRYDFPGNDYTKVPTQSLLASGGFRGDILQVGADGCAYLMQGNTRFADGTVTNSGSLVQLCPGFAPPVTFGPPNIDVSRLSGPQGETTIAASLTTPGSLVIGATGRFATPRLNGTYTGTVYAYRSLDGGNTWTSTEIAPPPAAFACSSPRTFAGDPYVAASKKDGNYYYGFLSTCDGATSSDLNVARSNDGLTWTTVTVVSGKGKVFHDKPMVAVDNSPSSPTFGRVYAIWVADDGLPSDHLGLVWSDDGGITWGRRLRLDTSPSCSSGSTNSVCTVWAPAIAVDASGSVAAVWYDVFFDQILFTKSSTPHGAKGNINFPASPLVLGSPNFGLGGPGNIHLPIAAQPENGINPVPSVLIDTSPSSQFRGRLYVTWTQVTGWALGQLNGSGQREVDTSDVVIVDSADGGANWSSPVRINDDPLGGSGTNKQGGTAANFFPAVALDPNSGDVHVSFYSTRLYPVAFSECGAQFCPQPGPGPVPTPPPTIAPGCNCKVDVFHALSTDGGASFNPNDRVTNASSDESTNNGNRCQSCFQYGDYEGIAVQNGAHLVWTDARTANFAAGLNEEVFTATLP